LNDAPSNLLETVEESAKRRRRARYWLVPLLIFAGWVIPGLGHGLLGRWGRGAAFFLAIGGLALTGLLLRGFIYPFHSTDPFGALGFVADGASGVFYLAAHLVERGGAEISRASGDMGTRFLAAAGVVNLIAIVDVFEIANGRRG
jgi:hypothetical protein